MSERRATEGPENSQGKQKHDQQLALTEDPRDNREKEVKRFLDRKRPEDVPIARKIAAVRLQNVDAERECCQERSAKPSSAASSSAASTQKGVQFREEARGRAEALRPLLAELSGRSPRRPATPWSGRLKVRLSVPSILEEMEAA